MKKNYYIGGITKNGKLCIAYEFKDKCVYWEDYKKIRKKNKHLLRFDTKKSVEKYVNGLVLNGNIAFIIESYYDLVEDIKLV